MCRIRAGRLKGGPGDARHEHKNDIAAVTNPNFELFLILHIEGSYEKYIKGHEEEFLTVDDKDRYRRAYFVLRQSPHPFLLNGWGLQRR